MPSRAVCGVPRIVGRVGDAAHSQAAKATQCCRGYRHLPYGDEPPRWRGGKCVLQAVREGMQAIRASPAVVPQDGPCQLRARVSRRGIDGNAGKPQPWKFPVVFCTWKSYSGDDRAPLIVIAFKSAGLGIIFSAN